LSLLAKHAEKCLKAKLAAFRKAEEVLTPHFGFRFRVCEFSGRVLAAIADQWEAVPRHPDSRWDWAEVMRRHRDPDRLNFAIWDDEDKLCAAGLGLTTGDAVVLRFLEGSPRMDCKLKGRRILAALETSANYAQGLGKRELRIQPINSALESLYRETYGFVRVSQRRDGVYYVRKV